MYACGVVSVSMLIDDELVRWPYRRSIYGCSVSMVPFFSLAPSARLPLPHTLTKMQSLSQAPRPSDVPQLATCQRRPLMHSRRDSRDSRVDTSLDLAVRNNQARLVVPAHEHDALVESSIKLQSVIKLAIMSGHNSPCSNMSKRERDPGSARRRRPSSGRRNHGTASRCIDLRYRSTSGQARTWHQ